MMRNVCNEITKEFNDLSTQFVKDKDKAVESVTLYTTKRYLSKYLTTYYRIRTEVKEEIISMFNKM